MMACEDCLYVTEQSLKQGRCASPELKLEKGTRCGILTIDKQLKLLDAANIKHFDVEVTCTADASVSCDDRGKPSAMCFSLGACKMLKFGSVKAI